MMLSWYVVSSMSFFPSPGEISMNVASPVFQLPGSATRENWSLAVLAVALVPGTSHARSLYTMAELAAGRVVTTVYVVPSHVAPLVVPFFGKNQTLLLYCIAVSLCTVLPS